MQIYNSAIGILIDFSNPKTRMIELGIKEQ